MKIFVIGDIHGCSAPLEALLEILSPDPETDRLILLGDLFDRGPDSWEVFQRVKELEAAFGERFVLVRGNHEDYLVKKHLRFTQRMVWERVGRKTTVRSFQAHGEKMEDAAPWILDHSVLFRKEEGWSCVHAGVKIDPPEVNDAETLMHDHGIVFENRYNGPLVVTGHIALERPAWFVGDGENVFDLEEGIWEPLPARGTICIDTGCGKGGRLMGMEVRNGMYMLRGVDE